MTDRVVVSADRTRLLPPNSPEKGYRITRQEAADLGLLDSAEKPVQARRTESQLRRTVEQVGPTAPKKRQTRRKRK